MTHTAVHTARTMLVTLVVSLASAASGIAGWTYYQNHTPPTSASEAAGSYSAPAASTCPSHDTLIAWTVKVDSAQNPHTFQIDWDQIHQVTVEAEAYLPPEQRSGFEQHEKALRAVTEAAMTPGAPQPKVSDFNAPAAQQAQRWVQDHCPDMWLAIFRSAPHQTLG